MKIKLALHWQMLVALILGALLGWVFSGSFHLWGGVVNGIGQLFMQALKMVVIPLVFLSTVLSISSMGNLQSMGHVAAKTFIYFLASALIAACIGVLITMGLRPGYGVKLAPESIPTSLVEQISSESSKTWIDYIIDIVPDNIFGAFATGKILPILFFAFVLGLFITQIQQDKQHTINNLFSAFQEVIIRITNFIIQLAPIGIFAIVMASVGKNAADLAKFATQIAFFIFVVWIALIIMGGVILPIMIAWMAHVSPIKHLKQVYSSLLVAFSTSSSYSAMPLILSDTREKCGVSESVAGFTIPLGVTFNKIGTIIYECVAVIFIAQVCDVELSIAQQLSLIGASIVTVLGAPAIPFGGAFVLAILLNAMNLPVEYIQILMAVDILCDMPKTLLNAYSISCSAIIVAKSEGETLTI